MDTTHQKGFRYAGEFVMPHNQNHSRFVNRLIFLRSWYVWDLHLVLHLRLKFSLNLLRLLRGEGEFGRLGLVSSRVEEEVCSPNLPMLTSSAPFHAKLKSTTKLQLHAASLLPLCPARFGQIPQKPVTQMPPQHTNRFSSKLCITFSVQLYSSYF